MMARKWLAYAVGSVLLAAGLVGPAEAQRLYVGPGTVLYQVWTPRVYWWNSGSYLSVGPSIYGYVTPPGAVIRPPGYVPRLPGTIPLTPRMVPRPFPYGYRPQPYIRPYYPPRPIVPYYGSQSTHPRPRPSQSAGEKEQSKAPSARLPDPNDETRTREPAGNPR
jgi:hypothetical protein